MSENLVKMFIDFRNLRDILTGLEEDRVRTISNRITEVIEKARVGPGAVKADGLAGMDKKDGGKDCGKDGKDAKEGSDDKEASDPEGDFLSIYGDPAILDRQAMDVVIALKAVRLKSFLASKKPIM
jgi:hypothetical protein